MSFWQAILWVSMALIFAIGIAATIDWWRLYRKANRLDRKLGEGETGGRDG